MSRNNISNKVYGVIYKIENKINGKVYIGQTTRKGGFDERYGKKWWENTHNEHLKKSVKKYGVENFEVTKVLKKCYKESTLNKSESDFIKKYDSTNPTKGYNKTSGGDNYKLSKETKYKIKNSKNIYVLNGFDIKNVFSWLEEHSIIIHGKVLPYMELFKEVYAEEDVVEDMVTEELITAFYKMEIFYGKYIDKLGMRSVLDESGHNCITDEDDFFSYFHITEKELDKHFKKDEYGNYILLEKLKELMYIKEYSSDHAKARKYRITK